MPALTAMLRRLAGPRVMRRIHGLLGFYLCLVLGFLCLFGTLTSIGHYIDWLADPALRVERPADDAMPASWGRIEAAVRAAHPDWTIQRMMAPQGSRFAAEVRVVTAAGQPRLLYVDPWRAVVTGEGPRETVQATLRQIHRQFYLPAVNGINIGVYLATPFGLVIFLMLVSGLVLYPRFWRGLFRLRLRQGSSILLNDLHRLVAGWSVWFLAVMSLTAMWYFAERLMLDTGGRLEPPAPKASVSSAPMLPLDELTAIAQRAFPEQAIGAVYFPRRPGDALRLDGQAGDLLVRDRANKVYLDPQTGAVLRVERIADAGVWRYWNEMTNPLHFGDFAGLWSRLVWFVFGSGLTALVFSGAWMYWARLRKERDVARRRAQRQTMGRAAA